MRTKLQGLVISVEASAAPPASVSRVVAGFQERKLYIRSADHIRGLYAGATLPDARRHATEGGETGETSGFGIWEDGICGCGIL